MSRELAELIEQAGALPAAELLKVVNARYGAQAALASSLGAEDQVLTDLIVKVAPSVQIFSLDTGRLPQETYDTIQAVFDRYGRRIEVLVPDAARVEAMVREHGPNLFYKSPDLRKACCQVRKVEPLKRKLAGLKVWITGLRRQQAVTRGQVNTIEWDESNGLIKLNPLADWTTEQVWDYIRANNVPYNALHDRGYPSIGCAPCTRAVQPGEDLRAGRWWWELPEHKECGLHVKDGRLVRKEIR